MKSFLVLGGSLVLASIATVTFFGVDARAAAPSPAAPVAAASTWEIDGVHSSVVFKVRHMGVAPFFGRFNQISGSVVVNDEKPAESKVELTIPTDSIDSNNAGRDKHLKSPDFFNAEEFPEIKFVSKTVSKDGKNWKVDGELSLHGVTKPVSVKVEQVGTGETRMGKRTGFDVAFTIKRSDFGMNGMLDGIGDEVQVMAGIECVAK